MRDMGWRNEKPPVPILILLLSTLLMFSSTFLIQSYYLPGVAPNVFLKGDLLKAKLRGLTLSARFSESDLSLPYCTTNITWGGIGELYDDIEYSSYEFKMSESQRCHVVCRIFLRDEDVEKIKKKIDDEYRVNMILDKVPLVVPYKRSDLDSVVYQHGVPVGGKMPSAEKTEQKYFINNHLRFTVKYHKDKETDAASIVGFEVKPFSVKYEYEGKWNHDTRLSNCDPRPNQTVTDNESPLEVEDDNEIIFTYDVEFQESEIKWASRWDTYLYLAKCFIHWCSIFLSWLIVLSLGAETLDMLDTIWPGISECNLETLEETEHMIVLDDVFRPPKNIDLLCVFAGTGVQCFGMILVTMVIAALGILSPLNRGRLIASLVCLWDFMGLFAGYTSARLYKMFKGTEWKRIALKTAFLFPGIVCIVLIMLNAISWRDDPHGAVAFGTMFALVLSCFGISVPLVFVGSYVGIMKPAIEDPVRINKIPRRIAEHPLLMNPVFPMLIGGLLPFGVVSVELFFILTSMWLHEYYILGFLFSAFLILIITCAEISVVLCYFQLCREDYSWWRRSYLTVGSSSLYLFLYATLYFTELKITKPASVILYFGYTLIGSFALFVLTGTVGFFASFFFIRHLYASVTIDGNVEELESLV